MGVFELSMKPDEMFGGGGGGGGGGEGGGGGNLMMGWHLIQEVVAIPLVASCRAAVRTGINCGLIAPLGSSIDFTFFYQKRTVVSDKTHALTSWGMVLVYCFGMCKFLTTQD